ncbi:MAG TPA: large conductance mechanosensitive channel protein MscL [Acidimicrobiia bacterium]
MKKYWKEFVAFVMTGNVLMLAVAFVMGGLTKAVIDDFVKYIVNGLLAAIVGKPDFSALTLDIGKGRILYGAFINTVINLAITGAVLFLIVKTYDAYRARKASEGEEPEAPNEEVVLLRRIADALDARP